ncbi:hypothetical protein J6590_083484 [Homalodisca vitripennis]|nr:hypothetical protein J6590_083484 [Homalodisca vitripennis]
MPVQLHNACKEPVPKTTRNHHPSKQCKPGNSQPPNPPKVSNLTPFSPSKPTKISIKCKNNNRKPKPLPLPVPNPIPFESVVIEGDSHVRHTAGMTSQLLSRRVSVTGVCKPGARLLQISSSQPQPVTKGTRCSVLIAGTNDLAAGEQRNIYDLEKRITSVASHNRLIVATLPHRHDLPTTHDINQHTALVNAYIEELAARHHISVLDMNILQRNHFTRQGMHLHTRGKWQLAGLIVEALGGLSASTAAPRKAEVVPDTRTAVPPMLPPPPPPLSLPPSLPPPSPPPSLPPPPPPPSLSPSLPPPPPPSPSPPPSDSIQLTPEPPMPTISCDDAVKEDQRNGPVVHSAASNLQEQRIETAFLGTPL